MQNKNHQNIQQQVAEIKHCVKVPNRVFLPRSIGGWLTAAHRAALPYAVYHVVADGAQNQRELPRQIIKVQGPNTRQVGSQVSVDPRTLDAYESTKVQTCPGWIFGENLNN